MSIMNDKHVVLDSYDVTDMGSTPIASILRPKSEVALQSLGIIGPHATAL